MAPGSLSDTSPDAVEIMSELYAKMSPEQKLGRVRALTLAVNRLALAGLRKQHPGDTDEDLRIRLRQRRLVALGVDVRADSVTRHGR